MSNNGPDSRRGRSLTPASRSDEVSQLSFRDGLISGALALIPSGAAVWYGINFSPTFRKVTNYQSRTALVIMPPLFAFAVASELKLVQLMKGMAGEAEHSSKASQWADAHLEEETKRERGSLSEHPTNYAPLSAEERDEKLSKLYLKSVGGSGVRIVPGENLGYHHILANFWQENPFKILVGLGVPAVGYIFHQRNQKSHLLLQQQIMQTRVMGQFTVLVFLLGLMGFKEYMDQNGKFITEADAQRRVNEMKAAKNELQYRLALDMKEAQHTMALMKKAQNAGKANADPAVGVRDKKVN